MAKRRAFPDLSGLRPIAKSSRLRYGSLDARGVPAILIGAAAIVLATGVSATLRRAAAMLPETLREARFLWTTIRPLRPELRDDFSNAPGR